MDIVAKRNGQGLYFQGSSGVIPFYRKPPASCNITGTYDRVLKYMGRPVKKDVQPHVNGLTGNFYHIKTVNIIVLTPLAAAVSLNIPT